MRVEAKKRVQRITEAEVHPCKNSRTGYNEIKKEQLRMNNAQTWSETKKKVNRM
jgi:hypothetical protein